jgi:hypothetical protein
MVKRKTPTTILFKKTSGQVDTSLWAKDFLGIQVRPFLSNANCIHRRIESRGVATLVAQRKGKESVLISYSAYSVIM